MDHGFANAKSRPPLVGSMTTTSKPLRSAPNRIVRMVTELWVGVNSPVR